MSDKAKSVFNKLGRDVAAEIGRLGDHGAAELAAALFSGHSFLPYGAGQRRDHEVDRPQTPEKAHDEREIER